MDPMTIPQPRKFVEYKTVFALEGGDQESAIAVRLALWGVCGARWLPHVRSAAAVSPEHAALLEPSVPEEASLCRATMTTACSADCVVAAVSWHFDLDCAITAMKNPYLRLLWDHACLPHRGGGQDTRRQL